MPIACGHCGGAHASIEEVRACAVGPSRASGPAAGVSGAGAAAATGRSVVVAPGAAAPPDWASADRVRVDSLDDDGTLAQLEAAWRERTPLVIELTSGLGLDDPATPPLEHVDADASPAWTLGPWFALRGDRWHHAVW